MGAKQTVQCETLIGGSIPKPFFQYPMAYNGRISSVAVSGTDVLRPKGFFGTLSDKSDAAYRPSQKLDFEMEMGDKPSEPHSATLLIVEQECSSRSPSSQGRS